MRSGTVGVFRCYAPVEGDPTRRRSIAAAKADGGLGVAVPQQNIELFPGDRIYIIRKGASTSFIGQRSEARVIALDDITVSKRQARIDVEVREDDRVPNKFVRQTRKLIVTLTDLQSRNGTYVNDGKLTARDIELQHGDRLRFGLQSYWYVFEVVGALYSSGINRVPARGLAPTQTNLSESPATMTNADTKDDLHLEEKATRAEPSGPASNLRYQEYEADDADDSVLVDRAHDDAGSDADSIEEVKDHVSVFHPLPSQSPMHSAGHHTSSPISIPKISSENLQLLQEERAKVAARMRELNTALAKEGLDFDFETLKRKRKADHANIPTPLPRESEDPLTRKQLGALQGRVFELTLQLEQKENQLQRLRQVDDRNQHIINQQVLIDSLYAELAAFRQAHEGLRRDLNRVAPSLTGVDSAASSLLRSNNLLAQHPQGERHSEPQQKNITESEAEIAAGVPHTSTAVFSVLHESNMKLVEANQEIQRLRQLLDNSDREWSKLSDTQQRQEQLIQALEKAPRLLDPAKVTGDSQGQSATKEAAAFLVHTLQTYMGKYEAALARIEELEAERDHDDNANRVDVLRDELLHVRSQGRLERIQELQCALSTLHHEMAEVVAQKRYLQEQLDYLASDWKQSYARTRAEDPG